MNTPYSIYEIDQRKKLNTLSDFENQTPTHIGATHAFSKILQNFESRIRQTQIVERKKLNTLGDFENQTPTHIGTTHAFSKILQNFENRIPRELDQKLDIPRISTIH